MATRGYVYVTLLETPHPYHSVHKLTRFFPMCKHFIEKTIHTWKSSSLVPRPRPAFCRLQYCKRRKAGRGLGTRLDDQFYNINDDIAFTGIDTVTIHFNQYSQAALGYFLFHEGHAPRSLYTASPKLKIQNRTLGVMQIKHACMWWNPWYNK